MFMGNGTWAPCAGSYVDPTMNVTCTLASFAQGSGVVGPYVSGSQFDPVTVKLNFTDARSGISHTDVGNVQGKIE
ncbi:hypothetical protein HY095_05705 [Candidatus Micrarchaeota archaeon]|nr:hypothetical protein [Candidatus Micrarchaeota archaeon]